MNYYENHIGDYDSATAHLSALEDGIYGRLLRLYYRTEAPVVADLRQVCRLVRAQSKQERQAVEDVLCEFFELREDGWHQHRCDEEIARFKDKQRKARASAEARWLQRQPQSEGNANASPNAMRTHSEGNANGMHRAPVPTHQTPITSHQSPGLNPPPATGEVVGAGAPTEAGTICRTLRKVHGIPDTNPGHPRLLALLAAGATDAEFAGFAAAALDKGRPFEWLLGAVEGERTRAAGMATRLHKGPMPAQSKQAALEQRNAQVAAELAARFTTENTTNAAE